jgi:hypothetical protein
MKVYSIVKGMPTELWHSSGLFISHFDILFGQIKANRAKMVLVFSF